MSDKLTRSLDNEVNIDTAKKEVQRLLEDGNVDLSPHVINNLRTKYSDDNVVDAIMEMFSDRRNKITKVSTIFLDAFQRKYKDDFHSMSMGKFMKRTLKYKSKYNLSNDEFDEIKRMFENRIFNSSSNQQIGHSIYPNTNLSRVFGYPVTESTDGLRTSSTDDYGYLQNILKLYQLFRSLHSYIVIQAMTYEEYSSEMLAGTFDITKHNINVHVHPVIAALFVPKIQVLEERMLYANIAGIINSRYNRTRIITKPDYELFYSMIIDPSDTICDSVSPMKDLESRVEIQIQLWNNVYNLRNGKFFEHTSLDFMTYIDKCKTSPIDNPDLIYLSDEGVILKRLFSIFAFRPITVRTIPILGVLTPNPLNFPVNMLTFTTIPYMTHKIQYGTNGDFINDGVLHQDNPQPQYYMENGTYVPKITKIVSCNGPLIYYVPRRALVLPLSISGRGTFFNIADYGKTTLEYQTINPTNVDVPPQITLDNEKKYYLSSAVIFNIQEPTKIILGHYALLFKNDIPSVINIFDNCNCYNPRDAIKNNHAIMKYTDNIEDTLNTKGSIFVYDMEKTSSP